MGNKLHENEVKISITVEKKLVHVSYLEERFMKRLGKDTGFVRQLIFVKAKQQYGIDLDTVENVYKLFKLIEADLYKDRADWVRDIVRHEILQDSQGS